MGKNGRKEGRTDLGKERMKVNEQSKKSLKYKELLIDLWRITQQVLYMQRINLQIKY